MFYLRKIYPELKKHLKNRQITVLTGMRRSGKTTLVEQLLSEIDSKNKLYLDFQRLDNQELFLQKNYDNILVELAQRGIESKKKMYLVLDEIQLIPEVSGAIKYLYDHYDIKFIVTGSSSYYLKNLFTESLAGRKKIFDHFPLDFGEFLTFKKITFNEDKRVLNSKFSSVEYERLRAYYEEYIEFGGFPEVVLAQSEKEKKDLLQDIISSYINIDIKTLADFRKGKNIYELVKMLASRAGTRLDYSKLSRLAGVSRITVNNYIDFFEKTYLIYRTPVFTKNPDREIVKAQKVYFSDNGILNILADLNSGSKFENAIFCQLRQKGNIRYFSLKDGQEIDFIFNNEIALEVKEKPLKSDENNLKEITKKTGLKKYRLIGRHKSPKFENYIWGGEIK
ncbi:MAG: ATP-binding protein [Patescibacteria group bacterium]|jgi:predicted AAA+ superfamily ATPase|nr:ATP-binding protein [Patescibacteria group bacterium]